MATTGMQAQQIDKFFQVLARELDAPALVILSGAAAGSIWGSNSPCHDLDFSVRLQLGSNTQWESLELAIRRAEGLTSTRANYAEEVNRGGGLSVANFQRHTIAYRTFGKLKVRLLDPAYWCMGKISRYLDSDIPDLAAVLKRRRVSSARLLKLWAEALQGSPRSAVATQFQRQAGHFLRSQGRAVWGESFDPEAAIQQFQQLLTARLR